jgi:hypothetical protein
MRVKAARILVALYAFCLVAPIAGFAFADGALAAHCLDMPQGAIQVQHSHHHGEAQANEDHGHGRLDVAMSVDAAMNDRAGMDHSGAGHSKGKSAVPACCGVMCVSAIPASLFELVPRTMSHASIVASSDAGIAGEAPDRRYRPPIVLLSL